MAEQYLQNKRENVSIGCYRKPDDILTSGYALKNEKQIISKGRCL